MVHFIFTSIIARSRSGSSGLLLPEALSAPSINTSTVKSRKKLIPNPVIRVMGENGAQPSSELETIESESLPLDADRLEAALLHEQAKRQETEKTESGSPEKEVDHPRNKAMEKLRNESIE